MAGDIVECVQLPVAPQAEAREALSASQRQLLYWIDWRYPDAHYLIAESERRDAIEARLQPELDSGV